MHVQGANKAAEGQVALYITPSTRTEISFGSFGKFLGGFPANGVLVQSLIRIFVKELNPVEKR